MDEEKWASASGAMEASGKKHSLTTTEMPAKKVKKSSVSSASSASSATTELMPWKPDMMQKFAQMVASHMPQQLAIQNGENDQMKRIEKHLQLARTEWSPGYVLATAVNQLQIKEPELVKKGAIDEYLKFKENDSGFKFAAMKEWADHNHQAVLQRAGEMLYKNGSNNMYGPKDVFGAAVAYGAKQLIEAKDKTMLRYAAKRYVKMHFDDPTFVANAEKMLANDMRAYIAKQCKRTTVSDDDVTSSSDDDDDSDDDDKNDGDDDEDE